MNSAYFVLQWSELNNFMKSHHFTQIGTLVLEGNWVMCAVQVILIGILRPCIYVCVFSTLPDTDQRFIGV